MDLLGPFLHSRSKHTLGRAAWYGGVVSLLVMVTALNVIPLQPVVYVSAVRVAGSPRLEEFHLPELARNDGMTDGLADRNAKRVAGSDIPFQQQLIGTKVVVAQGDPNSGPLMLDVFFVSRQRVPESELFEQFQLMASAQFPPVRDESSERNLRWAQWRKEVLKHSISQVRHEIGNAVELPSKIEDDSNRFANLAEGMPIERIKSPFQVASVRTNETELADLHHLENNLLQQFRAVEESVAALTDHSRRNQLASTQLTLLQNSIRTFPRSGKVEPQQLFGLLIMGLASWLMVGWIYLYVARGGGADPQLVAKWLERLSVPYAGSVRWSGIPGGHSREEEERFEDVESKTNWYFQGLEYLVLVLVLWVLIRFSLDPHWRILLLDQPLSGLARLCIEV